ncbi:MAG: GH116 family glycosyl hydrolase [Phycisphaerae bacterium]
MGKAGREPLETWLRGLASKGEPIVYDPAVHRQVRFGLGGVGAGSVAICPDGRLRAWQIFNRVNRQAELSCTGLWLWAKADGSRAVVRQLSSDAGRRAVISPVKGTRMRAEYPIATIDYLDPALPVRIWLEAYSPMVPLETKDSALPVAVFVVGVRNRRRRRVQVSVAASLLNAVGYSGYGPIFGVLNPGFGGNRNRLSSGRGYVAIRMSSRRVAGDDQRYGTMALAVLGWRRVWPLVQWQDEAAAMADFAADGRFDRAPLRGPSLPGHSYAGSLAVPFVLGPGQQRSVVFAIAWHFPNRWVDWRLAESRFRVGNMYNNWFGDALDVVRYLARHHERLYELTRRFRDTLYDSSLPHWLLDCVSSQASIVRSPTVMWLEDGTVAGFEGCLEDRGCCPMNCTHVWNYAQSMAWLYPELERRVRRVDLSYQQRDDGYVYFRTPIPLGQPQYVSQEAIDGQCGTVLKVYREHRLSRDGKFLRSLWPAVKKAMRFLTERCDVEAKGIITGRQHNTYDIEFYGANSYIGTLYLAALRAAEEMARIQGEPELAAYYRQRFDSGSERLDRLLFNRQYYEQRVDLRRHRRYQYGKGCLSDQVIGQWWAHLLDLGYVLPPRHVRRALESVYRYNWRYDLSGHRHEQRVFAEGHEAGLLTTTWPRGGRPHVPMLYCDEVWTGIEYQVASHMIMESLVRQGLQIARAARQRYDGTRRDPYCEVECGGYYARAMSSFALLLAVSGYVHDGPAGLIGFYPRWQEDNFRCFFSATGAWGSFSQQRQGHQQRCAIEVRGGRLEVQRLRLAAPSGRLERLEVRLGRQRLRADWKVVGRGVLIELPRRVQAGVGGSIRVAMR